jgi:hypothetical protein
MEIKLLVPQSVRACQFHCRARHSERKVTESNFSVPQQETPF